MICEDCPCPHLVARDGKCFNCTGREEPLDDEESAPSASDNTTKVETVRLCALRNQCTDFSNGECKWSICAAYRVRLTASTVC